MLVVALYILLKSGFDDENMGQLASKKELYQMLPVEQHFDDALTFAFKIFSTWTWNNVQRHKNIKDVFKVFSIDDSM